MEIASLIVSIISLTVLVIVTGIPFYRKHIEKKTKIESFAHELQGKHFPMSMKF